MIEISEIAKNSFLASRNNRVVISRDELIIDNENLLQETFELNESLFGTETFRFGCCSSRQISFSCLTNSISIGDELIVFIVNNFNDIRTLMASSDAKLSTNNGIVLKAENSYAISLGKFYVQSVTVERDGGYYKITAYDKMHEISNANDQYVSGFFDSLALPASVGEIRRSFLNTFGVLDKTEASKMINDDVLITRDTVSRFSLTGSGLLESICEINGCFGTIDRNGDFNSLIVTYRGLDSVERVTIGSETVNLYYKYKISADYIKQNGLSTKGFIAPYISMISADITQKNADGESETSTVSFGSGTCYKVLNNIAIYQKSNGDIESIFSGLQSAALNFPTYIPCKCECLGMPWLELGDVVSYSAQGITCVAPILSRKLSGICNLSDEFDSETHFSENKQESGSGRQIKENVEKQKYIGESFDGFIANLSVSDNTISSFEQTSNGFKTSVSKLVDSDKVISAIQQSPETISINASKITLTGYTTINGGFSVDTSGNMTSNNAIISGDIIFDGGGKVVSGNKLFASFEYQNLAQISSTLGMSKGVGIKITADQRMTLGYSIFGYSSGYINAPMPNKTKAILYKAPIYVNLFFPKNFIIKSVIVDLFVVPIKLVSRKGVNISGYGYPRDIKLGVVTDLAPNISRSYMSYQFSGHSSNIRHINNVWSNGSTSVTPTNVNSNKKLYHYKTKNIANNINAKNGSAIIAVDSGTLTPPAPYNFKNELDTGGDAYMNSHKNFFYQMGMGKAIARVNGYIEN